MSADSLVLEQKRMVPHARTLRNARENVKQMVAMESNESGATLAWCRWWMQTSERWSSYELLNWFIDACWDEGGCKIARVLQATCGILSEYSDSEIKTLQV